MADFSFDLSGKVALVTGCNTGLGQGMALAVAQAGADVIGVNTSSAAETQQHIEALGRKYINISAVLGKNDVTASVVDQAFKAFGHVDILINNAGIIRREDSINFSEKDWDDVVDLNLKTVFFMCQAVGKRWIEHKSKGKIINIASMLSFQGGIRVPSYTASKSGVAGITRLLACEWAQYGITINAIAPGYMATDNTEQLRADAERSKAILDRIPAGRWGLPADLAGPVVFLASSASDYVNGSVVPVDGGWLAR